ncbi:glycosyltransferase WbuB, partial [Methylophaga nitratireducenticrescens]
MKILLLSFYFEPDLCAGSFRCSALVNELKKRSDVSVDLITTQSNRYVSFKQASQSFEVDGNVRVYRVDLPEHQSGMADQIRSFSAYYRGAMNVVPESSYDLVVVTSSRLFTAFLGRRMAERFNCPLYLDIRDIFVDTMGDVLPKPVAFFAKPV